MIPDSVKPFIYYEEPGITLLHGDCLEILPHFLEKSIDLVLTDPPYGIGIDYGAFKDERDSHFKWLKTMIIEILLRTKTLIFTHRNEALKHINNQDWTGNWFKKAGIGCRCGNSPIIPSWEPVFMYGIHRYGTKSKGTKDTFIHSPEHANANIKGIGREKWSGGGFSSHPCPKPLSLFIELVDIFCLNGETTLDPFLGSGTTAVACKQLGRKCIGIELEQKYLDIAVERLKQEVLF